MSHVTIIPFVYYSVDNTVNDYSYVDCNPTECLWNVDPEDSTHHWTCLYSKGLLFNSVKYK